MLNPPEAYDSSRRVLYIALMLSYLVIFVVFLMVSACIEMTCNSNFRESNRIKQRELLPARTFVCGSVVLFCYRIPVPVGNKSLSGLSGSATIRFAGSTLPSLLGLLRIGHAGIRYNYTAE
jgi:hypothetical protein